MYFCIGLCFQRNVPSATKHATTNATANQIDLNMFGSHAILLKWAPSFREAARGRRTANASIASGGRLQGNAANGRLLPSPEWGKPTRP